MDVVAIGRLERLVGPFVALTVTDAPLDATAGEPVRERERIVVAPLAALAAGHPAEFGRPQNDRIVQHPARFQILDERRRWFLHTGAHVEMISREIFMAVPVAPRETIVSPAPGLHETNAPFEQSASDQAAPAKILSDLLIQSIELSSCF